MNAATNTAAGPRRLPGEPGTTRPVLELDTVTKIYPGHPPVTALAGVSLTIRQGELTAITGGGIAAAIAIGAIAGLLPALRAARMSPTEALRTG
jgi:ABC-type lipoprotein release transport system permease subunit